MTTGAILVQDALCQKGVLADDVAPSAAQLAVGLRSLNRMLESWGVETEMIYVMNSETFTTVTGQQSYTTADFVSGSGRPVGVDSITLTLSGVTYPCEFVDNQTFNNITFKAVNSIPNICYYDANFPIANFRFYPVPFSAFTVQVDCLEKLSGPVAAATDLVLPEGYERAVIDCLVVSTNYGLAPSQQMLRDASESLNRIKRKNYVPLKMDVRIGGTHSVNNSMPFRGF
jgi:hypothetical protein